MNLAIIAQDAKELDWSLMMSERPSLLDTFVRMAELISKRSTCGEGKQHGAVLVLNNEFPIALGYNGPARGEPDCKDICSWAKSCPSVHAEVNMVINAARVGVRFEDCVVYCTKEPCGHCYAVLKNAGVKWIHFKETIKPGSNAVGGLFPLE